MILPEEYQGINEEELTNRIQAVRDRLGKELVILGHHYQRDSVYNFADFTGDSFKLAKDASEQKDAKYIIFCGVNFMSDAARILASKDQRVFLPDIYAGCPMADLAPIGEVEYAWEQLSKMTDIKEAIPVTYMNSTAAIKAFCGANGGAVCTSSNAKKIFEWAFTQGRKIFFLPDEHLGRNTAFDMGIDDVVLWKKNVECGGLEKGDVEKSRVIVWNGFCHVHTIFSLDHITEARINYPDSKIIVHPECLREVVDAADASGSTEQIRRYVEEAPEGSTIVVGTEINMVSRLAADNPTKTVVPLFRSLCPNMFKISLNDLCWTLEKLGEVNEITVDPEMAENARLALQRMLDYGQ